MNAINYLKNNPILGSIIAISLAVLFLFMTMCGKATDLVNDIEPVHATSQSQSALIDRLQGMSPTEQDQVLREEWPTLATDVVAWLRRTGRIQRAEVIEAVTLFYGSGEGRGEDNDGDIHRGHFNNELLAEIVITGRDEPMLVAVRCTNGLFRVVRDDVQRVGTRSLVFRIGKGESLVNYVGYEEAIHLAEVFGLKIQKDRGSNLRDISADEALRTDTDRHQVRVLVYAGDRFDLGAMTYTPAM